MSITLSNVLHIRTCHKVEAFGRNPMYLSTISKQKYGYGILGNKGLKSKSTNRRLLSGINISGVPLPPPSSPPPNSWKHWILGMLLSAILPFLAQKWGPLLKLKNEAENVVETMEDVAEVLEKAAERVEVVAEEVADHLPEGSKLKESVNFIDHVAKEIDKDAHLAREVIDKVEEVEQELESVIEGEAVIDQPKKANDE